MGLHLPLATTSDLPPPKMAVDLIGRLDTAMPKLKYHVFKALGLPADQSPWSARSASDVSATCGRPINHRFRLRERKLPGSRSARLPPAQHPLLSR